MVAPFPPPVDKARSALALEQVDEPRLFALEAENSSLRRELGQARRILGSAVEHAIISLDPEGAVTSWNPGARNLLGYGEAEILGHSGEIFFTSEGRADKAFAKELRLASEQGRATNERCHLRKDGTRFWASGVMLPLVDEGGKPSGFLNIMRDDTEAHTEVERRALVEAELLHRVKNTFALAQAVASQSQRYAETPQAFQETFAKPSQGFVPLARHVDPWRLGRCTSAGRDRTRPGSL